MDNFLTQYIFCIIDCLIFYIGFSICFKQDKPKNKLFILLSTLLFALLDHYITNLWEMNEWICELTVTLVLFLYIEINFKIDRLSKIAYFLILECIGLICSIMIGVFLSIIGKEFATNDFAISVCYQLLRFTATFISAKLLLKCFNELNKDAIKQILTNLLVPCLIMTMLFELYFMVNDFFWFNLILVLFILFFILMIRALVTLVKFTQKEARTIMIEKMLLQTQDQVEKINNYNTEIREIKHDFTNHLIIIGKLNEEKKEREIKEYISKINDISLYKDDFINTNNVYLDAILNNKISHNKTINFQLKVDHIQGGFINEVDLCSLLFNLLDNAIYEVNNNPKLKKEIKVTIKEVNQELFIMVSNPLSNKKNMKTTKDDKNNHGLGLDIVKKIVNKYDGIMEVTQNDSFTIEIMI